MLCFGNFLSYFIYFMNEELNLFKDIPSMLVDCDNRTDFWSHLVYVWCILITWLEFILVPTK